MDHSGQAVKVHPNDMSQWIDIACQRGPDHAHVHRTVDVDLSRTHGYGDLPQVPPRLARSWRMNVWDSAPDGAHPVDGGSYCPAHDAVSETVISHLIWEPQETILVSQVCDGAGVGRTVDGAFGYFFDFGAQIGWFSLLAATAGRLVFAFEADADNRKLMSSSAELNGLAAAIRIIDTRIGPDTPEMEPTPIRLAKIDIEGAEAEAVRVLRPSIDAGLVDHLLIECSPVFNDTYPDLVVGLMESGYRAYKLPPKRRPPIPLDDFRTLVGLRGTAESIRQEVAGWHQENVFFAREGASW